jgi:hypothetical protein
MTPHTDDIFNIESDRFFVGCCATNPCGSTCAQGNLFAASFNTAYYGKFPDAQCGSLSKFYTCNFTTPAFLGCCKTGACASTAGCSSDNLAPAYLDSEALRAAYGASGTSSTNSVRASSASSSSTRASSSLSTATRASSTLSTTTTSVASAAASATTGAAITAIPHKDGPPIAAIAGGAVGGVLVLAVIAGLLIYYCCHAKKSRKGHEETVARRQSDLPAMAVAQDTKGFHSSEGKFICVFDVCRP